MLNSQQRHQRDLYQIALAHTGDGHERKTIGKHKPRTKLEKQASDRIWGRGGDFENLMECIAITYNKASGQKEKKATERRGCTWTRTPAVTQPWNSSFASNSSQQKHTKKICHWKRPLTDQFHKETDTRRAIVWFLCDKTEDGNAKPLHGDGVRERERKQNGNGRRT